MPEHVESFGYHLDATVSRQENSVVMVDIGGRRGEMLSEVKKAYPHLQPDNLILRDHYARAQQVPRLTIIDWDFKSNTPQPVVGVLSYSLAHIFHNLPDLDALELMQKISTAMASYSRLLIHKFSKNTNYGNMHAAMIEQFGG